MVTLRFVTALLNTVIYLLHRAEQRTEAKADKAETKIAKLEASIDKTHEKVLALAQHSNNLNNMRTTIEGIGK